MHGGWVRLRNRQKALEAIVKLAHPRVPRTDLTVAGAEFEAD